MTIEILRSGIPVESLEGAQRPRLSADLAMAILDQAKKEGSIREDVEHFLKQVVSGQSLIAIRYEYGTPAFMELEQQAIAFAVSRRIAT